MRAGASGAAERPRVVARPRASANARRLGEPVSGSMPALRAATRRSSSASATARPPAARDRAGARQRCRGSRAPRRREHDQRVAQAIAAVARVGGRRRRGRQPHVKPRTAPGGAAGEPGDQRPSRNTAAPAAAAPARTNSTAGRGIGRPRSASSASLAASGGQRNASRALERAPDARRAPVTGGGAGRDTPSPEERQRRCGRIEPASPTGGSLGAASGPAQVTISYTLRECRGRTARSRCAGSADGENRILTGGNDAFDGRGRQTTSSWASAATTACSDRGGSDNLTGDDGQTTRSSRAAVGNDNLLGGDGLD